MRDLPAALNVDAERPGSLSAALRLVRSALDAAHPVKPVVLSGLLGGAAGYALARLITTTGRPLVVIVPDGLRAALLADSIGSFLGRPDAAISFPAFDHLPFQGMSPPHHVVAERMGLLAQLALGRPPEALVIPATTLLDRLPPRQVVAASCLHLKVGLTFEREILTRQLIRLGYVRVPQVDDVGAFAVRGDIVDIFPAGALEPLRFEFFDDELESIRPFDASTQASRPDAATMALQTVGPVRDLFFTADTTELVRASLQRLADVRGTPTSRIRAITTDLDNGIIGTGLEDLLPAFFDGLDTLLDYLTPTDAGTRPIFAVDEPARVSERLETRWQDLGQRAARAAGVAGELVFAVEASYAPAEQAIESINKLTSLTLSKLRLFDRDDGAEFAFSTQSMHPLRAAIEAALGAGELEVLDPLVDRMRAWHAAGVKVLIAAPSAGGIERLKAVLRPYPLKLVVGGSLASGCEDTGKPTAKDEDARPSISIVLGHPGEGFDWSTEGLVVIDHTEVFGKPPAVRRRVRRPPPELALQSWRDLKIGDVVVHLERGVGRYVGLDTYIAPATTTGWALDADSQVARTGGIRSDLIVLEYAGGDKLYVPIEKLHLVSKHQGGQDAPKLDKLGGQSWQKTKSRVTKAVRDIADKLIRLHAQRQARRGTAFNPPDEYYQRFEAAFPWDETPDQARAIDEVIADLQRPSPMDRLVCGDVGFGKTEIAMRAAMKVVVDGWQVIVVVPTQVLAAQHTRVFQRRFEGFPIIVKSLTGMQTTREQKETVADLAAGRIDIIIGTHRLLSKDVQLKKLGLLIIDEEHRFGVAQKERLRELRPTVDVLTMTATPIPRTLHMSMVGLRDISLIQTPPTDRLPVQTFIAQPNDEVIREAIRRELLRGGQVFFVHFRVSDIERYAEIIRNLVPEARVVVGHGQMAHGELDRVMARFVSGEANVLVATTIIESGIDISAANTMIINRADCFGLAQLHQLRGRVGRSDTRAYCYLLIPPMQALASDAEQRLVAIQQFTELGSGFSIASHDLDIRGSGDILGADQAGNINAIGFEAYTALLHEAIAALKASETDDGDQSLPDPELRLSVEARIPEPWLPDVQLRLRLYRRLTGAETDDEVTAILAEIVDRYGDAPDPVVALCDVMRLKLIARRMRLKSVTLTATALSVGLSGHRPLDFNAVTFIVAENPAWRFTPEGLLTIPRAKGLAHAGREGIAASMEALLALDHSAMASRRPGALPNIPRSAAASRHNQDPRRPDATLRNQGAPHETSHATRPLRNEPPHAHGSGLRQDKRGSDPSTNRRVVDVVPGRRRGRDD